MNLGVFSAIKLKQRTKTECKNEINQTKNDQPRIEILEPSIIERNMTELVIDSG